MIPLNDLKAWAAREWAIFPCHNIANGACSCGRACGAPGKHPRTFNGVKAATTDMNQIRSWAEHYPDANWALATGEVSGVWVLDLDAKPDRNGADSLKDWIEQSHARMFTTHTVATGGGGWHYYWAG
ncbi:MAG: bifunctional DNA primase/polymerase, partial [Rhodoglobus sp.]